MTFAEHAADELGSRRLQEQTDGEREVAGNRDARHKKMFLFTFVLPRRLGRRASGTSWPGWSGTGLSSLARKL